MNTIAGYQQQGSVHRGRFWIAELIGWPVMLGLLLVLFGGANALSVLLLSIYCTVGLALVFWGFVAWLIGITIMAVYSGVTKRR